MILHQFTTYAVVLYNLIFVKPYRILDNVFLASKAKTPKEATKAFLNAFEVAARKAVRDLKADYKVENFDWQLLTTDDLPFFLKPDFDQYTKVIYLINEKKGCPKPGSGGLNCKISVDVALPTEITSLPPVLSENRQSAWMFNSKQMHGHGGSLRIQTPSGVELDFDKYELFTAMAKYLPKYTYIYLSSELKVLTATQSWATTDTKTKPFCRSKDIWGLSHFNMSGIGCGFISATSIALTSVNSSTRQDPKAINGVAP